MCFIKKLEYGLEPIIYICEHQCYYNSLQDASNNRPFQFANSNLNSSFSFPYPMNYSFLMEQLTSDLKTIMQRISANSAIISSSIDRLHHNDALLHQANMQIQQSLTNIDSESQNSCNLQPHCELNQIPFFSNQSVITKIFGEKPYKYKLSLNQGFPRVIYKQRNLNIGVKLINPNCQSLSNANLIHLCVGVCNNLGQWIIQQDGEFFIQGKTQIDLFHGQAEFKKISPKDVSRHFNAGIVNLVIYAKKSLVKFTGQVTKFQKIIDSDFIQPLLIKDITIKAKKKKSKHR